MEDLQVIKVDFFTYKCARILQSSIYTHWVSVTPTSMQRAIVKMACTRMRPYIYVAEQQNVYDKKTDDQHIINTVFHVLKILSHDSHKGLVLC